ncbi:MAG: glycosyltransferase [Bacteroidales bacterium]
MEKKRPLTLQSKGWRGFRHIYFLYCKKQFKHSFIWACCAVAFIAVVAFLSNKSYFELLIVLSDIGLKVAPPLLGFTLSGYAMIVGVNDVNIAERLKNHKTKTGITMYQQLYTTFIAMLGSIFLLLLESVVLHYVLEADISLDFPMIVDVIDVIVFLGYAVTMFYALFAVKDLLSNLFSLGQTANNIYQSMNKNENRKNILFLMKVFEVGGQEVVTATLADTFIKKDHRVVIACFKQPNDMMVKRTNPAVRFYTIGDFKYSKESIDILRNILKENRIDVVINQWGLPYVPCKVLNKAKEGLDVKTIAIYHNSPDTNARIKDVEIALANTHNPIKKAILRTKMFAFKQITSKSMKYVYEHTDLYMVLSPSFVDKFKEFTGTANPDHLQVLTNPVTIDSSSYHYSFSQKQKEIIFIGRIDYNQKRVYRVVDTWAKLESVFSDWKLTIVGDGTARKDIEKQVKEYGLQRVSFEGFQQPKPYYERASILMLTSEYEGFPLVLAECMSFGVIPAVYNSYSAVCDIIDGGKDGIVLPYHEKGYNANEAAGMIANIMKDDGKREQMALAAIKKSKEYSVEKIYSEWECVFHSLLKE